MKHNRSTNNTTNKRKSTFGYNSTHKHKNNNNSRYLLFLIKQNTNKQGVHNVAAQKEKSF